MRLKDYYKILEVHPTASQQDIKKAYRQLAIRYHPDKNDGDLLAENRFKEVQEAYHTLSDPDRRSAYNQKRWYRHSAYKESPVEKATPASILNKSRKLSHYVSTLDASRLNQRALSQYINYLLSDNNLVILHDWKDAFTNYHIISELLKASNPLPYKHMVQIGEKLVRLAGDDKQTIEIIRDTIRLRKQRSTWELYRGLIVLIITLIICFFIYFVSR